MNAPRFFTDEDVYAAVAIGLRRAGFDAVSTPEVGRRGHSDEDQLAWASSEERAIITFNAAHFGQMHKAWLEQGRDHAGIVISSQRPLRDVLRRVIRLAGARDAESMRNRLEFLGDW